MFGERLKEVRSDHNDTQASLAQKLNVSIFTVRSWEREKSAPSYEMLVTICSMYHVSADFLLGITREDPMFNFGHTDELTTENRRILKAFENFLLHEQNR